MLHAAAAPEAPPAAQVALQRVLRALDVRHPEAVDAAVNGALAPLRARGGSKLQAPGSGSEGGSSSSSEGEAEVRGARGGDVTEAACPPDPLPALKHVFQLAMRAVAAPCVAHTSHDQPARSPPHACFKSVCLIRLPVCALRSFSRRRAGQARAIAPSLLWCSLRLGELQAMAPRVHCAEIPPSRCLRRPPHLPRACAGWWVHLLPVQLLACFRVR